MQTQTLKGYWQVRQVNTLDWLPAHVPGGVHTDLMAAGKIPDPFYGTNEEMVQWVAEKNWEYRRYFYPHPSVLNEERVWLVCDGLDTLAEVRLNGKILGQADNLFRSWQWEVKNLLKEGENKLEIRFRSPVVAARNRNRFKPMHDMNMGIRGGQHLRKAPSHFGWDWGPRLPGIGIWKDVRLEGRSQGRLGEIRLEQDHSSNLVTLTARIQCELWTRSEERHTARLRITGPDRQVWQLDATARPQTVMTIPILNPHLWWPNGYGAQPLYEAEVELLDHQGNSLDARSFILGLRNLELRQDEDEYGKSFTFVVNGVSIFCKGSNWIPVDSFPMRAPAERIENLIRAAAETHQNMLRVWGGGYYESDLFYDLCDRYGILVWQDFQFSCATYPLDDPVYLDNVRCEAIENIQRLRHHPSLALWCGNNEIEWLGLRLGWFKHEEAREIYRQFFFEELPNILSAEDPDHSYWPGSPSSNDPFQDPNSFQTGDAHLWEVYSFFRPPRFYREQTPRFVSEFGFQSLPALASIEQFCSQDAHQIDSAVMNCHQRAAGGNPKLIWYLAQRFRLPRSFAGLVYLSQVFQAEAVRNGVEHWRRHPEQTSGALYWQLNDCWPVTSWASIDYYGRWKALHYAARRFFDPVLLSIEDQTQKKQRRMDVWLTNDHCEPWQGRLNWTLETLDGEVLEGGDQSIYSQPQSAECLIQLNFARQNGKVDWRKVVFVAELWQGTTRRALQVVPFVKEGQMLLQNPDLRVGIEAANGRLLIPIEANTLARFVELAFDGADVQFSDNYIDLPAGRVVTVACELPDGWTVDQARQRLRVRSLNDNGPFDSAFNTRWKGNLAIVRSLWEALREQVIKPMFKR